MVSKRLLSRKNFSCRLNKAVSIRVVNANVKQSAGTITVFHA